MPVTKVITEKVKAKEGKVEVEITKDIEKGKIVYSLFQLTLPTEDGTLLKVNLDDKDAKNLISLFGKIFKERKEPKSETKQSVAIPIADTPVSTNKIKADTVGIVEKKKGVAISQEQNINKMTLDSIRARTGQRKTTNPIIDKINNREGDGSHDPKFNQGIRKVRNPIIDKINSHSDF